MAKKITLKKLLEIDSKELDETLKSLSFEDGLSLTDELVESVENGDFALEDSLKAYERGVALIKRLKETLSAAEEKLETLNKD